MPGLQVHPIPARAAGHFVRCLGWDNLCRPLSAVSTAITRSLAALEAPYEVVAQSDGLGFAFVVDCLQPAHASRLCVSITVHAAEHGCTSRHHVSLRRIMGECWQLKTFYAAFRKAFSANLGFANAAALANFSPLQYRRYSSRDLSVSTGTTDPCTSALGHFFSEPAMPPPLLVSVNAATANCSAGLAHSPGGVANHAVDVDVARAGQDEENVEVVVCDAASRLLSPSSADHVASPSLVAANQSAADLSQDLCASRSPARPR